MKKLEFLVLLVFASAFALNAQQTASSNRGRNENRGENRVNRPVPTAQEMADKETARETKMLNLTPEQVEQVKAINLNYSQQRADAMKTAAETKDRPAMETQMQGIRLAQDNELKTILTTDQQAKLTKAHSEMGNEQHEGNRGKGNWKNKGKGQNKSETPEGGSNN
jgi:hypothetical protein